MGSSPSESEGTASPRLDTSTAHSARVWNYLLGGQDNFVADREIGDVIMQIFPDIAHIARVQRRFLARAVRYLAGEAGIRQFLDIGTGLPAADHTHQMARRVAPSFGAGGPHTPGRGRRGCWLNQFRAMATTARVHRPRPARWAGLNRSCRTTRASRTVTPGYSDTSTAAVASMLKWVA